VIKRKGCITLPLGHYLHGAVVNDHGVKLNIGIQLSDFFTRPKEKAVTEFHDVGLVDGRHLEVIKGSLAPPRRL
jgi:hypothetical protein